MKKFYQAGDTQQQHNEHQHQEIQPLWKYFRIRKLGSNLTKMKQIIKIRVLNRKKNDENLL